MNSRTARAPQSRRGSFVFSLANAVNTKYPGRLPYDFSWNLTGYSDIYLMNQGLIAGKEDTDAARSKADLTPYKEEIRAMATKTPQEFSTELRKLLP